MIPRNSAWHEQQKTKIGDYGEELVMTYLESRGHVCYKALTDKAHLLDYFIYQKDREVIAAEVKTKPSRKKYPDTGFDYRHYEGYKKFTTEHNMRMFIFFVDDEKGEIYGNFLHELDKPRKQYPLDEMTRYGQIIRYYPLEAMIKIRPLTQSEILTIRTLRGCDTP